MPPGSEGTRLSVPASLALPGLDDVVERVVLGTLVRTSVSHHDTDDLALHRWGVALRHHDGAWLLRVPAVEGIPDSPLEHRWAGPGSTPPAPATTLLTAFTRRRPVQRVARVVTRRTTRHLLGADGALVAELHDDEVSVHHGRRLAERFRELLLVPGEDGDPDTVARVRARLRDAGADLVDEGARAVRVLGPAASAPPDVPVPEPAETPTAGDVVRAAIADSVRQLILADPHARLGVDEEGVHKARVASRRLRSDLRTFRPLLDEAWTTDLRDELRWLAATLGAVRDADVLTRRLAAAVTGLGEADRTAARPLMARLADQRDRARRALLADLDCPRYLDLLDRLVTAAADPLLRADADGPADQVLPALVQHPWTRLRGEVDDLDPDPADGALHQVRIRAKRLRYAAEAVQPEVGKRARRLAVAAARVQTVLGDHQDACVAEAWLRDAAAALVDPYETFVAGLLAGRERAEADRLAAVWGDEWARLDRKKVRGWL